MPSLWDVGPNRPSLPSELPGRYAIIVYDRDDETYQLHVDDVKGSSYSLGDDIQTAMMRFELWGHYKVLCNTLDVAREYGAAQGIFKDGRVIPLFDRSVQQTVWDEKQQASYNLPSLKL